MKRLLWNKHTKRLFKHVVGWLCIGLGIVFLITPGQGILTILIGVYLLADEVPLFQKLKNKLEHRFPKTADFVHRKNEQIHRRFQHKNDS